MSDTEATRESLPSISDLSINPQTPPITKTPSTDGKPKKEAAEKGWSWVLWRYMYIVNTIVFFVICPIFKLHCFSLNFSGNIVETNGQRTNY